MASNGSHRPGRPVGGEAMGLRAFYTMIEDWVGERLKNAVAAKATPSKPKRRAKRR
jgi:hypothetical protein